MGLGVLDEFFEGFDRQAICDNDAKCDLIEGAD